MDDAVDDDDGDWNKSRDDDDGQFWFSALTDKFVRDDNGGT
jgi:hypothetical protein